MSKQDSRLAKATKITLKTITIGMTVFLYIYVASVLITSSAHGFDLHKGHLAGYSIVPGTGESMEPTFNRVLNMMVVKKTPIEEIRIGDVVTYQVDVRYEDGTLGELAVVHRVIGFYYNGLITKGDNNDWIDNWVVCKDDLSGRVDYIFKWGIPRRFEQDEYRGETFGEFLGNKQSSIEEIQLQGGN